jgi:integrating conjugative element protein (TIGR03761 family)
MHDPLLPLDIRRPELVFPPSATVTTPRPSTPKGYSAASAAQTGGPTIGRLTDEQPDALTLHTREAWKLFTGRQADAATKAPAIPGARRYASILRSIWVMSAQDNPYADWFLIRSYRRLSEVRSQMDRVIREREIEFDRLRRRGLSLSLLSSSEPAQVELGFRSPYGYAVAQAVLDFDVHVRMVQTLVLKDLLSDDAGRGAIREIGRTLRALFQEPISWERGLLRKELQALGRRDFVSGADADAQVRARAAVALFGEVPREIFTGEEAPRHTLRRAQLSAGELRLLREATLSLQVEDSPGATDAHLSPQEDLL